MTIVSTDIKHELNSSTPGNALTVNSLRKVNYPLTPSSDTSETTTSSMVSELIHISSIPGESGDSISTAHMLPWVCLSDHQDDLIACFDCLLIGCGLSLIKPLDEKQYTTFECGLIFSTFIFSSDKDYTDSAGLNSIPDVGSTMEVSWYHFVSHIIFPVFPKMPKKLQTLEEIVQWVFFPTSF